MALRFHNTLTQRLEEFVPADGKTVRMYTCGPTVYSYVHVGNFRTFAFQDILRRTLRARGNTIEEGTSEIQRSIIAERLLGMPVFPTEWCLSRIAICNCCWIGRWAWSP